MEDVDLDDRDIAGMTDEWFDRLDADFQADPVRGTAQPGARSNGAGRAGGLDITEIGLASGFVEHHLGRLRVDHERGAWYRFDGAVWRLDATNAVAEHVRHWIDRARKFSGLTAAEFDRLGRAKTVASVITLARDDQRIAVLSSAWDPNPWVLGTPGGVVDLRSGELRPAEAGDMVTRTTATAPAAQADCPLWVRFLDQASGGDAELVRFLRQWGGYCLTGSTREQALLFVHGSGGNGKGVFIGVLAHVLGEYARSAPAEVFAASRQDRHTTELARLAGARLVTASETDEGRAWAEARIKALTGGDVITARFMRQDDFEFRPQFKLTIVGNHAPTLRTVDDAMRRRLNVVPFLHTPARKDPDLEAKLKAEAPGILRWLIEGCLDWQANGLLRPASVVAATEDYLGDQDALQRWIDERCLTDQDITETTDVLFASWRRWAEAAGEQAGDAKGLTQALARMGFERLRHTPGHRGKRGFKGIAIVPDGLPPL